MKIQSGKLTPQSPSTSDVNSSMLSPMGDLFSLLIANLMSNQLIVREPIGDSQANPDDTINSTTSDTLISAQPLTTTTPKAMDYVAANTTDQQVKNIQFQPITLPNPENDDHDQEDQKILEQMINSFKNQASSDQPTSQINPQTLSLTKPKDNQQVDTRKTSDPISSDPKIREPLHKNELSIKEITNTVSNFSFLEKNTNAEMPLTNPTSEQPTTFIINSTIVLNHRMDVPDTTKIEKSTSTEQPQIADRMDNSTLRLQIVRENNPNQADDSYNVIMKIHPPELGQVIAKLQSNDKSAPNLYITAENAQVRDVILANIDNLRHEFQQSGFQLNQIEVNINQDNSSFNQNANQFSQNSANHDLTENTPPKPQSKTPDTKKTNNSLIDTYA